MTTLTQWKRAKVHDATLPSGVDVKISLPDVPAMIEAGHLPQNYLDAAIAAVKAPEDHAPTPEEIKEQIGFRRSIISTMLVEPKISEADVDELPVQDQQMLMEFAMRTRDIDAKFHHLGGLEKYDPFREVRGIPGIDPILESLSGSREAYSEDG